MFFKQFAGLNVWLLDLFVTVSSHESSGKSLAKSTDDSNGICVDDHVKKASIDGGVSASKKHDGVLDGEVNKEESVTSDQQEAPRKEVDYSVVRALVSCVECQWFESDSRP